LPWRSTRNACERPSNTTLTITGDAGAEVSGYLAAYLVPFLVVVEPAPGDLVAYAIFLVVAGLIYVRSGLMQINPTVYLMNRRSSATRAARQRPAPWLAVLREPLFTTRSLQPT
jgi:hypothetical protein